MLNIESSSAPAFGFPLPMLRSREMLAGGRKGKQQHHSCSGSSQGPGPITAWGTGCHGIRHSLIRAQCDPRTLCQGRQLGSCPFVFLWAIERARRGFQTTLFFPLEITDLDFSVVEGGLHGGVESWSRSSLSFSARCNGGLGKSGCGISLQELFSLGLLRKHENKNLVNSLTKISLLLQCLAMTSCPWTLS